ncbi:hypothetical protein C483_09529 [Natrialba hulunbeirensis JCM 10989]|uniref:HTH marR-type domain-containing protein n=1 Tax=Natrialba hulunbeirensis JCM 10989 TaxID=1227493 RepID=L9ZZI4_9EURY|nr:hypothetical protein C483_09529 [Natrialba hulunbeirensis JCM 10989]
MCEVGENTVPISIDEFDHHESPDRRETNAQRVLRFLIENRNKAFRAAEIAEETDVNVNSIQPVLNRLRSRELVRHKEPYWAIGDIERIQEAAVFHSTAEFLDEELGSESREAWLAAAEESANDGSGRASESTNADTSASTTETEGTDTSADEDDK